MNAPLPTPRDGVLDRLANTIERMSDTRLTEHHGLRVLHRAVDGVCAECGKPSPCPTLAIIDRRAAA